MLLIVIGWTRGKVVQTFQIRFTSEAVFNFFFKSIIAELSQVSFAEKNCLQVIFQIYLKIVISLTKFYIFYAFILQSKNKNPRFLNRFVGIDSRQLQSVTILKYLSQHVKPCHSWVYTFKPNWRYTSWQRVHNSSKNWHSLKNRWFQTLITFADKSILIVKKSRPRPYLT